MVVTRSGVSRTRLQKSPQQKSSIPQGIGTHLDSKKESGSNGSTTGSQADEKQSSALSRRRRKSRATGPPAEVTELATDGETSEVESHASGISSVCEAQEPIIRVTRKRRFVIAPTSKSSVRKKQKLTPQHESLDEGVVSEAESHASGVSMLVPSVGRGSRTTRANSQTDSSQESQAEVVSDDESSCSGVALSRIAAGRAARNLQKKVQAQEEMKGTKITPGNKKQILGISVDSEDSDIKQTSQLSARPLSQINSLTFSSKGFDDSIHRSSGKNLTQNYQDLYTQEETQADVASLTEIRKESCKSLGEEDPKIIEEQPGICRRKYRPKRR